MVWLTDYPLLRPAYRLTYIVVVSIPRFQGEARSLLSSCVSAEQQFAAILSLFSMSLFPFSPPDASFLRSSIASPPFCDRALYSLLPLHLPTPAYGNRPTLLLTCAAHKQTFVRLTPSVAHTKTHTAPRIHRSTRRATRLQPFHAWARTPQYCCRRRWWGAAAVDPTQGDPGAATSRRRRRRRVDAR